MRFAEGIQFNHISHIGAHRESTLYVPMITYDLYVVNLTFSDRITGLQVFGRLNTC